MRNLVAVAGVSFAVGVGVSWTVGSVLMTPIWGGVACFLVGVCCTYGIGMAFVDSEINRQRQAYGPEPSAEHAVRARVAGV